MTMSAPTSDANTNGHPPADPTLSKEPAQAAAASEEEEEEEEDSDEYQSDSEIVTGLIETNGMVWKSRLASPYEAKLPEAAKLQMYVHYIQYVPAVDEDGDEVEDEGTFYVYLYPNEPPDPVRFLENLSVFQQNRAANKPMTNEEQLFAKQMQQYPSFTNGFGARVKIREKDVRIVEYLDGASNYHRHLQSLIKQHTPEE